ncbi:MAG: hypothetical protein ACI8WB_004219 [Phenylobacterium sp.]|jgi:hypothetical protein
MKNLSLAILLALPTASVLAATVNPLSVDNMGTQVSSKSEMTSTQSLLGVPATPSNYPGNGGNSYQPIGEYYSIPFSYVSGATYYELYESTTDSNYSLAYSGSQLSTSFIHHDYGYQYYKYKACNTSGCSGLSPWRRMYIYTAPDTPNNANVSPTSVTAGTTYNVTWTPSGGAVDGTVYSVYESYNSGTEKLVSTETRQHWSETSYSYSTSRQVQGDYSYRIQACTTPVGCGSSVTVNQTVTTSNSAPTAYSQTAHASKCYPTYIAGLGSDPDGDTISVRIVGYPHTGSASAAGNGMWYYPPFNCLSNFESVNVLFEVVDSHGLVSPNLGSVTIFGAY